MKKNVIIVGTGQMAQDHIKVLRALETNITVIGRGKDSASIFEEATGIKPIIGGFENYLDANPLGIEDSVIVAVGTEMLMPILLLLANQNFDKALIEKPGALSVEELLVNSKALESIWLKVFIGYNRRFYSSVNEVKKLINEDGGLKSMHFEFTEWSHIVGPLQKASGVKENWFFANSSHVVDLAFFIAGNPTDWCAFSKAGEITWHNKTNFSGAGETENNVLFSYISNWESAGRWSIELLTNKRRLFLKPIEGVGIQLIGTINVVDHTFDNSLDIDYKPGLYNQSKAFLFNSSSDQSSLINLKEQVQKTNNIYKKVLN